MTVNKSDQEWKQQLTPEEYRVLRQKGTEAPGTGKLLDEARAGIFVCAGCEAQLFPSSTKFDSHCGWPSFYDALPSAVELRSDDSLGMERTEAVCRACGGHLGHVFSGEGHQTPTDQRYCINSVSLKFKPGK